VLAREERHGDVIGFLHTHPGMAAVPSERDVRTMHAWCSAFGKPLLCLIKGADGLRGWRFGYEGRKPCELELVEYLQRDMFVGVECDGRQVPS
jgi:proteasome lid subunit RPN8/RPN11